MPGQAWLGVRRARATARQFACASAALIASLSAVCASRADPVADFYRGKQIILIVGTSPGGGYDLLARMAARHLGRFIPGRPSVVVENMPGADSVIMSNKIYNSAPQDGTVIGLVQRGVLISDLIKRPGVHYDAGRFHWIGNMSAETSLVVSWAASPVKTFQDLFTHGMRVGGSGDSEASASALNALVGTKLKVINGYPGSADIVLAMERGEVDGMVGLSWSEMKVKNKDLLAQHKFNLLAQDTLVGSPELPGVPVAADYIKGALKKQVGQIVYGIKQVARPLMTGPGVPPDRVAALRQAFDKMIADPDFVADARKQKLDLSPSTYETVDDFIAKADASSAPVINALTKILTPSQ